jgi:hypothetical protein
VALLTELLDLARPLDYIDVCPLLSGHASEADEFGYDMAEVVHEYRAGEEHSLAWFALTGGSVVGWEPQADTAVEVCLFNDGVSVEFHQKTSAVQSLSRATINHG